MKYIIRRLFIPQDLVDMLFKLCALLVKSLFFLFFSLGHDMTLEAGSCSLVQS